MPKSYLGTMSEKSINQCLLVVLELTDTIIQMSGKEAAVSAAGDMCAPLCALSQCVSLCSTKHRVVTARLLVIKNRF